MRKQTFNKVTKPLEGELIIPGDKSISHRAIMLGSLAKGRTTISHFLHGEDCLHTIDIFKQMGVSIKQTGTDVVIESHGVEGFVEPKVPLYFGNSGTTARLMLGILSSLPFYTTMYGDPHLTIRPMDRVVGPLREMGAAIDGREKGKYLPLSTFGRPLSSMTYELPVKSAQVKSAVLFAGLFAEGKTTVIEKAKTRDHTENMMRAFGADITVEDKTIHISNQGILEGIDVHVPGDISSAAFFIVAAALVPGSQVTMKNVGLNETRTGIIDVLLDMGANISITNKKENSGELAGDITVTYTPLKGTTISGDMIPRLIDEIPIIALLATQAKGKTIIKDAEELRVKETDRITAVVDNLKILGANISETKDGMIIEGNTRLTGGDILSYSDHRMAMMGVIASLISEQPVTLDDTSSIAISYPTFFDDVAKITQA